MFDASVLKLDVDGLRRGRYADPPYLNIASILSALARSGYQMEVKPQVESGEAGDNKTFNVGDAMVETHWIVRRQPFTVLAGVPKILTILRECTGFFDDDGTFVNTSKSLEVEALDDGELIEYNGQASDALPILIVRGRYRDFALLKTPLLGTLARASRIATNVYRTLQAAAGKPVYFFSARYDPPEVQAADGYAYHLAVKRFNEDRGTSLSDVVSTYANAEWWGGEIEGTISHEGIACFLGDAAELMVKFAELLPTNSIRVALVDFHNDCVSDTRRVMRALFERYRAFTDAGAPEQAKRYKLHGVRADTSKELVDKSLSSGAGPSDYGSSPRLVKLMRETIDNEWRSWDLPEEWLSRAERWCRDVKIMVSGGFTAEKIKIFESERVPVDFYGVGSAMLSNCAEAGTITDFSCVVMRVKIGEVWCNIPKEGRRPNHNPRLRKVEL